MDYKKDLAEKLTDLKQMEGFPVGAEQDILDLSQPPYYTACPNPYLAELIASRGVKEEDNYFREAFLGDIFEGKEDVRYNLHTYHTKVPPNAIVKKLLHYTNPGDIVLDGFSGTGMTGLAAFLCGSNSIVNEAKTKGQSYANIKPGIRRAILNELSPIAALISKNYAHGTDGFEFRNYATKILSEVQAECDWMFECRHGSHKVIIDYTVFSDVFICPFCSADVIFWDVGVDVKNQTNMTTMHCQSCNADLINLTLKRKFIDFVDDKTYQIAFLKPVMIAYSFQGKKYTKDVDDFDLDVINRIENSTIPYWYPKNEMPKGEKTDLPSKSHGLTRVDFYYSKRSLYTTASIFDKILKAPDSIKHSLLFWLNSVMIGQTKMNRYFEASYSQVNRYLKGTLYVGKKISEVNFLYSLRGKLEKISKYLNYDNRENCYISNGSVTDLALPDNSIDYIFTDPPFGANIIYSELNFIWECWLKIFTNNKDEAIISKTQHKKLDDYTILMENAFKEYYRVLKPKRWITVEFHNSKSEIWNSIQNSMNKAGFIVSSVTILDKIQETFNQMNSLGSVKSDLTIQAFKPDGVFEKRFLSQAGINLEMDFVDQYLSSQPVKPIIERTDKMLYSKMLAYYIQRGYEVRQDSRSFYNLLQNNFVSEDGFWFTSHQINSFLEYKKA